MSAAKTEESARQFVERVGNALLRAMALALMGATHWALDIGIGHVIPANFLRAKLWLEDVSFLFFLVIYLYLLFDLLKVFIPSLQSKPYPEVKKKK